MSSNRYNDYYLVNDEDLEIDVDSIDYKTVRGKSMFKKIALIFFITCFAILLIAFICAFIVIPVIFMNTLSLQQDLIFTHWNLPTNKTFYKDFSFPGFKNHYITVKDIVNHSDLKLGLWHILPYNLAKDAINSTNYDYEEALLNSNYSVVIYFHGAGEDRSQSERKYQLLRLFFHVIAFDYRCYGDSSKGDLFEKSVVHDSIQIFNWVKNRTNSPIYFWGHSLGTSLATSTLSSVKGAGVSGLVLEAPFTSLKDELYVHPYIKYLAWLPWFEATIIKPLQENGFIFDTYKNIQTINCPIMFLHAEDDEVVPYTMSEKLYKVTSKRNDTKNDTFLHIYKASLGLNHYFIYQDPYTIFFINNFMNISNEGSHQS